MPKSRVEIRAPQPRTASGPSGAAQQAPGLSGSATDLKMQGDPLLAKRSIPETALDGETSVPSEVLALLRGDVVENPAFEVFYHGTNVDNLKGDTGIGKVGLDPNQGGLKNGCKRWENGGLERKDRGWTTFTSRRDLAENYAREHSAWAKKQNKSADQHGGTTLAFWKSKTSIRALRKEHDWRVDPGAGDRSVFQTRDPILTKQMINLGAPAPKAEETVPLPPKRLPHRRGPSRADARAPDAPAKTVGRGLQRPKPTAVSPSTVSQTTSFRPTDARDPVSTPLATSDGTTVTIDMDALLGKTKPDTRIDMDELVRDRTRDGSLPRPK